LAFVAGYALIIAIAFAVLLHKHHAEDVVAEVINNYFFVSPNRYFSNAEAAL
jgi:hypothetical protein